MVCVSIYIIFIDEDDWFDKCNVLRIEIGKPPLPEENRGTYGIPNSKYPSDHFPIAVIFKYNSIPSSFVCVSN